MSNRLKILVDLNNEKYSIFVESDCNVIEFKCVYNEIIKQTKHNISFETHLFELYDMDFKEYVLITNDREVIENLSRIRIKTKDTNQLNKEFDMSCVEKKLKLIALSDTQKAITPSEEIKNLDMNSIQNKFNNLFSEKKCQNFDKQLIKSNLLKEKNVNNERVDESEELINHLSHNTNVDSLESKCMANGGQTHGSNKSKAINYLELDLSPTYITSSSSRIMSYKTFVIEVHNTSLIGIRFHVKDYKAIRQLLDLLVINRRCFERNGTNNLPSNPKWKIVSDQMVCNGYEDWFPLKCRDGFDNSIELYKKCLNKCPDFDTADAINPLFFALHSFDFKFLLSLQEFNEIKELRHLFEKKNNNKFVFKDKKFGSDLSLVSMNADFENQKRLENKAIIDRSKLRKMAKMNEYEINLFKAMVKCVETVAAQFGHVSNVSHFWELVSNQMKANGYKNSDAFTTKNMFIEYVCDYYSLLLIRSPDYKSAKMWPLFEFIHAMDLSQCLSEFSFNKIKDLREKFAKKVF